ncbi:TKL protein kinase [Magnaporthiopsis poae ATCC 64411]|uniref:TKL protein kinase n=1 Tax=Magnaporthiopsis poae (strain ATCC 64411 / 73-15) TaxID=644358 RepID=A0A0C4DUL0_MAGP6|nr:TKL protein kinase [Magnaporthiopsis poae ATCC 64411]
MDRSGRQLAFPDSDSIGVGSHGSAGVEEPGRTAARESNRRLGPGFIDILDFGFQWGIPSMDLIRVGVASTSKTSAVDGVRVAYTVGAGHTATVIQHQTGDEESDILPQGTTIALKIFRQSPTYAAILGELGVFCHPELSEHPNFVKLLFLGWRSPNPFPILGMELGEYGSLDYILCAPGAGLSRAQKAHITMDIAVGLHALHSKGLVHGDLKPGNIVVFKHPDPERALIAKLTDFGGSSRRGTAPGFITSLWSPPEVLHGDPDIEWDKCDVYSYGLVVASIWSRPETFEVERRRSSCILESSVPESLVEDDDRENFLLVAKSVPEDNPSSALHLSLRSLSDTNTTIVGDLLKAVLVPLFWQRPSMIDIVTHCLAEVGDAFGRSLRDEVSFRAEKNRFIKAGTRLFKVWSESFRKRPRAFQEYVLRQLEEEVGGSPDLFNPAVEDIPDDIDEAMSSDEYIELLRLGVDRRICSANGGGDAHMLTHAVEQGRICFHIALCYLFPIGTDFSLETGLRWLRAAVLGGYMLAAYMFPILQNQYPEQSPPPVQERLMLAVAGLTRSLPCLDILASKWPAHYRQLIGVIQGQHTIQLEPGFNDVYHMSTILNSKDGGGRPIESRGIWDSIMSYDLDRARSLLERQADNGKPAATEDDDIAGALHALTYIRDADAASLARLVVSKGADLNAMRPASQGVWATKLEETRVTSALSPAISRGQLLFAQTMIGLHEEKDVPIKDFARALIASVVYRHYDLAAALFELRTRRPSLCDGTPPAELIGLVEQSVLIDPQNLLLASMDDSDMHSLENRAFHGPRHDEAYANTLMLLIGHGANPTDGFFRDCPLYRCLLGDDQVALRCFIRYLRETYDGDPFQQVVDPGHCRGQTWSANGHTGLQTCIYTKSRRCFHILLREFPLLIEEQNLRGLTALHSATFHQEDLELLQALLDQGANVLAVSKDNSSPLMRALRNRNLEAAELITRFCSPEQLAILFRRQPDTGRSLFSRLIDAWLRDRNPELIASFRWAIDQGAAHFYGTTFDAGPHRVEKPLWNDVLANVRPPSEAWQLRDLELLNLLFATFPDRINELQQDGRGPLHVATWYGHVEAVRSLLHQHGADVNLEFGVCEYHPTDPRRMLGRTALNLVIKRDRASGIPDEVRRGGHEDIARWRADCAAIKGLLLAAGGRSGSGASFGEMMEVLALDNDLNVSVDYTQPEPFEHDDIWRGAWPEPLPRDSTSVPLPDLQKIEKSMKTVRTLLGPARISRDGGRNPETDTQEPDGLRIDANWIRHEWRLPEGWEVRMIGDSGRFYFVDHNTRSTTWRKPPLSGPGSAVEPNRIGTNDGLPESAPWR